MTLRAVLPASERRLESVTVARACQVLGCDPTTVRALLRAGAIDGHRVGKGEARPNGVRLELQSLLDYKARHAIAARDGPAAATKPRRRPSTAAHREALAQLAALGIDLGEAT